MNHIKRNNSITHSLYLKVAGKLPIHPTQKRAIFSTDFLVEIFLNRSSISHILCSHTSCVNMPKFNV